MKKKLTRILGVALPLAMVLALAITLLPASTPTAEADVVKLEWSKMPLPKYGAVGKYALAPDTNVGPIAATPAGNIVFAATNINAAANMNDLLKSSDGGYTWTELDNLRATALAQSTTDNTSIVAIAASPEYASDTTVFVATCDNVYQSVDGGKEFSAMTPEWGAAEDITDMGITLDSGDRLSIIVGTTATSNGGDVYVYCPATTGMSWKAQAIGTRNVLAAAFSPNFPGDEGIFAVTVNGTDTLIQSSFGNTKDGSGWDVDVGYGLFRDQGALDVQASRARMAFPDDFDVDSITSNIIFVGLVAGTADGLNAIDGEEGDVYKTILAPGAEKSSTIDLNVRGLVSTIRTATNIWSIDVSGDAEAANIVVGTDFWSTGVDNYYWLAYYSTDSGATWLGAREKSPTGGASGANTNVVISPTNNSIVYAATKGDTTSALSRTTDGGKSWNQIGLIDWPNKAYATDAEKGYTIGEYHYLSAGVKPVHPFQSTNHWRVVTYDQYYNACLWETIDGGASYDRIFSYANPTAIAALTYLEHTGDTLFLINRTAGKFYRSSDLGVSWPRIVSDKKGGGVTTHKVVDATTIYTGYAGGELWYTTNLGRPWVKPEESEITGTVTAIGVSGDTVTVANDTGGAFISSDGGKTFERVGPSDLSTTTEIKIALDGGYATNHIMYGAIKTVGGGVWRIEINPDDPGTSSEWRRIDNLNDAAGAARVYPTTVLPLFGVLYIFDSATVNVTVPNYAGGIWRCVNATADTEGMYPPEFVKVNKGLLAGDVLGILGAGVFPNTPICGNANPAQPWDQLLAFSDTLSSAAKQVDPADEATGRGIKLTTFDLTLTEVLSWEAVTGATSYRYQVATDTEFKSVHEQSDTEEGQMVRVSVLLPGRTYYWRVRVEQPLLSPWSETRSFTVGEAEPAVVAVPFDIISPERGASDISIQPTFVWAEVEGATSYELVVAEDPTFAIIDWSRTSANAFFKAEETLAYDTTYAWRVRPADGEWATGVFTTEATPVEPVEPIVIEPTAPAEIKIVEIPAAAPIPTYLLWTIIGVGAVLFIALIVLIVRTRRVT